MPNTFDPKFLRDSAAEARAMAERLDDPKSRRILMDITSRYDQIAEQASKILGVPVGDNEPSRHEVPRCSVDSRAT
jgi:hypothetical protein